MRRKRYKLTDQKMQTRNSFQWELNKPAPALSGKGGLCSAGWYHFYTSPLLAVLLNPIHANISEPRLFEAEVGGKCKTDRGLKEGYTKGTLVKEIPLPVVTLTQKVAFGILCALEVYKKPSFVKWAKDWLKNTDRTYAAAEAVRAAYIGAYATTAAFAANAAYTSFAEVAAKAAAYTSFAEAAAFAAAVRAAFAAKADAYGAYAKKILNLKAIARKAIRY
jgi:hypothetical protein